MTKLNFYYSARNAGKTTSLLHSAHNDRERGVRTLILTPRLDDRHGRAAVASRIGLKSRVRMFVHIEDVLYIARSGDAVRITTELVNARSGYRLWPHHYDGSFANIFKV